MILHWQSPVRLQHFLHTNLACYFGVSQLGSSYALVAFERILGQ